MSYKKILNDVEDYEWASLNDHQQIKSISLDDNNTSIYIIAPKNVEDLIVPFFCPLCEIPMTTRDDVLSYKKNCMCEECHYKWNIPPDNEPDWELNIPKLSFEQNFKTYKKQKHKRHKPKINLK